MRIVATDLTKRYGTGENQVIALHKANLEIQARDFISIVGPSGSGKSTLLHLISGLDYPTEGVVEYDGQNIHQGKDAVLSAFRRRRIGFIFQKFHLIPCPDRGKQRIYHRVGSIPRPHGCEDAASHAGEAVPAAPGPLRGSGGGCGL